jgi:hypothetical protein
MCSVSRRFSSSWIRRRPPRPDIHCCYFFFCFFLGGGGTVLHSAQAARVTRGERQRQYYQHSDDSSTGRVAGPGGAAEGVVTECAQTTSATVRRITCELLRTIHPRAMSSADEDGASTDTADSGVWEEIDRLHAAYGPAELSLALLAVVRSHRLLHVNSFCLRMMLLECTVAGCMQFTSSSHIVWSASADPC